MAHGKASQGFPGAGSVFRTTLLNIEASFGNEWGNPLSAQSSSQGVQEQASKARTALVLVLAKAFLYQIVLPTIPRVKASELQIAALDGTIVIVYGAVGAVE